MEKTVDAISELEIESQVRLEADVLPKGWMIETIDSLFSVIRGASFPKDTKTGSWAEDKVACLRTANVQHEIEWKDLWFIDKIYLKSTEHVVRPKDIIISTANSLYLLGKCAIVKEIPTEATWGAFIVNLRYHDPLNTMYLYYYLLTNDFKNEVNLRASTTTNISNISVAKLKTIPVKIAPLPEQHRIVEKIEELFSEIDKGVENLEKAKAQLGVYRIAALNQAFDKPDIKFEVKSIKEMSNMVTSGSRGWAKYYSDEGEKFIRIGNMSRKTILLNLSNVQNVKLPHSAEGKRSKLNENDLLISITADLGSVSVVPENIGDAYINQHIAMVRLVNPAPAKYLAYYLKSTEGSRRLLSYQRGATKVGLGLDDIRSVKIPIPPLEEQHQIVQEIESRLSVCDKVEESIEQGLKQAEMLKQSILKKAFEGKLVPQNPEDEPASVLLERIRQERESLEKAEKASSPKTKKKTAKGKKS